MNKVEEVARAIYEAGGYAYDGRTIGSSGPYGEWAVAVKKARAAISAMGKPTEGMLAACWHNHHPWGENAPPPSERQASFEAMKTGVAADWNAMILTALSEASAPPPKQETTE